MKFFSVIAIVFCFIAAIHAAAVNPECSGACQLLLQPTCGFNGQCYKEYSNVCFLKAAACKEDIKEVNLQECRKPDIKKC
ncbi:hypothetical protein DOY81_007381 [Sarcophaga bullata]|nr:hypothetical protein DOY81_007381 [Sarcophaga bullata]